MIRLEAFLSDVWSHNDRRVASDLLVAPEKSGKFRQISDVSSTIKMSLFFFQF